MSQVTPDLPATPPPPAKKRGLFAFFFKSALGCTAFAFGVLIALILLLPTLLSGPVGSKVRTNLDERIRGTIEIGDLTLGWFHPVEVRGIVLRDPDKHEVARGNAVLPSLSDLIMSKGGTRIGRVMLEVDADLVADDQGVTNLQRALEPRVKEPPKSGADADKEPFDAIDFLSKLDLDLQVKSNKLSWSDADTRRVGTPFEVRDLLATVRARPGEAIQAHVGGRVVADQPGALEMDATLHGPIDSKKVWPFGKVDAKGSIEGFSTAMVDGLANLNGGLKELFGPHFQLRFKATDMTPESGDLDFSLEGGKATIAVTGRFVDGVLRSTEKPGVLASIPPPRRLIDVFVKPKLPAGSKLWLDADDRPWTLKVPRFALPLPPAGAHDLAAMRPTLEKAEIVLDVDVPSHISFENEATKQMATPVAISASRLGLTLAPNAPASLRLESSIDTGVPGKLQVDATLADLWPKLAAGALPVVDAQAKLSSISTAALGALAGKRELVRDAIGAVVDVSLEVKGASLDAGRLALTVKAEKLDLDAHAGVANGLVRCTGDDRIVLTWRVSPEGLQKLAQPYLPAGVEIVPAAGPIVLEVRDLEAPLPDPKTADFMAAVRAKTAFDLHLVLPGASFADDTLRAAKMAGALSDVDLAMKLAAGGATSATLRAGVATQPTAGAAPASAKGKLAVDFTTANPWGFAGADASKGLPPVDVKLTADDIATASIDALAGQHGLITRTLGDKLSLSIEAKNASLKSGDLRLDAHSQNVALAFAGRIDGGVLRASGDADLHGTAKIPADVVAEQLKTFLPAGASVTGPAGGSEVRFSVRDIAVPLPDSQPNAKPFDPAATLEASSAKVHVEVASLGWSDEKTRAAKLDVGVRDLVLDATLAPKSPLTVKLGAALVPGPSGPSAKGGKLGVDATVREPFAALKGVPGASGSAASQLDAKIEVVGLDTAALDALASQGGLLSGVLGPELALTIDARGAGGPGGTFRVDAKSETTTLHVAAKLASNVITCSGDEGIDLSIALKPAFVEARTKDLLPAGTHLRLEENSGPVTVKVRDVRIALPSSSSAAATIPAGAPKAGKPDAGANAPSSTAAPAPSALEQVAKLALKLDATFPAIVYSDATTDAAKKPVALRDVRIEAALVPTALPTAKITGRVVDDPPGEIVADVRALDPLAKLAEPQGLDTWRAKVVVRATKVPTAIVDMLAAQKGVLVEALGARMEAGIDAPEISLSRGAFVADMKSDLHSVHVEGHLEPAKAGSPKSNVAGQDSASIPQPRRLVIDKVDGLTATVAVGPLLSERIVGKLVPMLFDLQKPPGADPARFAVDSMSFPLDGDLSKLDAVVRVDLGEISYKLLPSILGNSMAASNVKLPPMRVPIQKGIATYDKLPIKIAGRDLLFSGTFSLVDETFKLGTEVPLEILGKSINGELDAARGVLDPKTAVPLEIRGTWKRPTISIGKDFLDKVIKGAANKGLEGLLKGLGGKKKKD